MDVVTVIAIAVTAAATVAIAIFAIPTIQAYRKQVEIGQEQLFNQVRPVLLPMGDLGPIVNARNGKTFIQIGNQNQVIEGLRNIGVGPAFNIYGVIFGPPVQR